LAKKYHSISPPIKTPNFKLKLANCLQISSPFAKHCVPKKASHPVRKKKTQEYVDVIDPWLSKSKTPELNNN
jgi:hypothetical protein